MSGGVSKGGEIIYLSLSRKIFSIILVLLVMGISTSKSVWGGFKEGMVAFRRGDYVTALKEWKIIAEEGNANAQNNLGVMYRKGFGVLKNDKEALSWYQKAADQGLAKAQFNLGAMHERGQGVPQNYEKAAKWYRKAAEQRYAKARHNLIRILIKIKEENRLKKERREKEEERRVKERRRKQPRTAHSKLLRVSSGTGFIVSFKGHVITNHHVVKGCNSVMIHKGGYFHRANIVAIDRINDLALLKINFRPNVILPLRSNNPRLLEEIFVAGYPFGKKISSSLKITKGVVSSVVGLGDNYSNFQIDAAMQPGNSGGPITDGQGNVIGVSVHKVDPKIALKEFGAVPENTNFGVKVSSVIILLDKNNVTYGNSKKFKISTVQLGQKLTDATLYLSCWMSPARIQKMNSKRVPFERLIR